MTAATASSRARLRAQPRQPPVDDLPQQRRHAAPPPGRRAPSRAPARRSSALAPPGCAAARPGRARCPRCARPGRRPAAPRRPRPGRSAPRRARRSPPRPAGAGRAARRGPRAPGAGRRAASGWSARELVGAVGGEEQERQVGEAAREDAQQVEGGGVGPVQVVQQQDAAGWRAARAAR